MRVTVEGALRVSVVARFLACKVPDDQRLVTRSREKHVRAVEDMQVSSSFSAHLCHSWRVLLLLDGCGQAGDPAGVAVELALHYQLFSHVGWEFVREVEI